MASRFRAGRRLSALEEAARRLVPPPGLDWLAWLTLAEAEALHDLCESALADPAGDRALAEATTVLKRRAAARFALVLDMGAAERQARQEQRLLRLEPGGRLVPATPHPLRPGWFRLDDGRDMPEAEALACTAAHPWP